MKTVLVTGGAGFIGSNLVRRILERHADLRVINLDALTYAGNLENLADVEANPRYSFVKADVSSRPQLVEVFARQRIDQVLHLAAESHVDRSILDPGIFIQTNVQGTQALLDVAREHGVERFVHVSTDEVYGSLGDEGQFTEETPLQPNSPYSASKAGSDLLVRAAYHTHGMPVLITRCSNNYGPYQFPEKLIPLMIGNALEGKPLPVYGDGRNVRDWIHVEDHCDGLLAVLSKGRIGEVYNLGGRHEVQNLEVVRSILQHVGRGEDLIQFVKDRPGHDRRYAMDIRKAVAELGWSPRWKFSEGLAATIEWYRQNRTWAERVKTSAYRDYYEQQYGNRG